MKTYYDNRFFSDDKGNKLLIGPKQVFFSVLSNPLDKLKPNT